jgi:hypothetical protein
MKCFEFWVEMLHERRIDYECAFQFGKKSLVVG